MKKLTALLTLLSVLFLSTAALAENTGIIPEKQDSSAAQSPADTDTALPSQQPAAESSSVILDEVNVILYLNSSYRFTNSDYAIFTLSDGTSSYQRAVSVAANREALGMTFDVSPYEIGKTFTLTIESGIEKAIYYGRQYSVGEPMTLYTYSYADEFGIVHQSNTTYMEYIPTQSDALFTYFNGENVSDKITAKFIDNTIMVPIEQTARLLEADTVRYDYSYNSYVVAKENVEILFNIDNVCTTISGTDINIPAAPRFIGSVAYCPLSTLAGCFGASVYIDQTDAGSNLNITYKKTETVQTQYVEAASSKYVNTTGLDSDTDYLIWVSKSEFIVRVYLGKKGQWEEIQSFPCAIGADDSETIEGTFKYHEYVTKWDYGTYYVGPVLRFKNGYALHSTLINNDGSARDDRVGVKISHGCVRLKPTDIDWLAYYIPLSTTVHVTG